MPTFKIWTCVFPGKRSLSWKRASFFDHGTKEEAEQEAVRYANVVAVPVELRDHLKEIEHRMVAAERKLNEFGVRQDYKDGVVTYKNLGTGGGLYTLDETNICTFALVDHETHGLPEHWYIADGETNTYRNEQNAIVLREVGHDPKIVGRYFARKEQVK